jgi:hypothetical protein
LACPFYPSVERCPNATICRQPFNLGAGLSNLPKDVVVTWTASVVDNNDPSGLGHQGFDVAYEAW